MNYGHVIPIFSQVSVCLWGETEAEGKSSRGRGTGVADNAWHGPKAA